MEEEVKNKQQKGGGGGKSIGRGKKGYQVMQATALDNGYDSSKAACGCNERQYGN